MTTAGISHGTRKVVYDFLHAAVTSLPLRVNDTAAFVDAFEAGNLKITLGGAATGNGSVDLADNGLLAKDIKAAEFLVKLDSIDTNADFRIGLAGAHNADPDAIAQCAWFKIAGAAGTNEHTVSVETDDATLNIDNEPTAKKLVIGAWHRLRIDLATGIQTISPPAKSKGGLGSVQFYIGRESQGNTFLDPVKLTKHMDISAIGAAVALQPMIHGVQSSSTGTTVLNVRQIALEYATH